MKEEQHASQNTTPVKTKKVWTFSVSMLSLGLAVAAGALLERHFGLPSLPMHEQVASVESTPEALRDAALIHHNLNVMASQIGQLRAKADTIARLGERLAVSTGADAETSELHKLLSQNALASDEPMEDLEPANDSVMSAEELGRELDSLKVALSRGDDMLKTADLAMQLQGAELQRTPTAIPVSMNNARISSTYGWRKNPVTGRHMLHSGVDFAAPAGSSVYAASAGIVVAAGWMSAYGNVVDIDHGKGVVTRYAHNSKLLVKAGDLVAKRQVIAKVGSTGRSTGAHVHFEVRVDGEPTDPIAFLSQMSSSTAVASTTPDSLLKRAEQVGAAALSSKIVTDTKEHVRLPSGITTRPRMR